MNSLDNCNKHLWLSAVHRRLLRSIVEASLPPGMSIYFLTGSAVFGRYPMHTHDIDICLPAGAERSLVNHGWQEKEGNGYENSNYIIEGVLGARLNAIILEQGDFQLWEIATREMARIPVMARPATKEARVAMFEQILERLREERDNAS